MSDQQMSFALRHQARRAALLAELLREKWDGLDAEFMQIACDSGMSLPDAVAAMSDQAWVNAADEIARRTGKPFRPPSDATRTICIGLLSVPHIKALKVR